MVSSLPNGKSFGKANRPQTPVKGIIQHDFGTAAADALNNKYEMEAQNRLANKKTGAP